MKRILVISMMITSLQSSVSGQSKAQDVDLSLSAKAVVQDMERTIQQARQKALDKLKIAMKSEMQAGNLGRANSINQVMSRIAEEVEKKPSNEPNDAIVGEWKRSDGVVYTFSKNFEVRTHNGWAGVWKIENKKVAVILNVANGKPVATSLKHAYELPVKKEMNKQVVLVMQAALAGYEDTTLYRNE